MCSPKLKIRDSPGDPFTPHEPDDDDDDEEDDDEQSKNPPQIICKIQNQPIYTMISSDRLKHSFIHYVLCSVFITRIFQTHVILQWIRWCCL